VKRLSRDTFKKIITTKENSDNILPKNRELINKFIREKDRKCSDKTIIGYTSDLEIFFTWNYLYNENKYYPEIKKREMSEFFNYCVSELKWGSARFGRLKSCLSGLSDFIVKYYDEELPLYRNFIKGTIENLAKVAVRTKTILTEDEIKKLLAWLKENGNKQEACLLSLAINSGARISELIQFKITSIEKDRIVHDGLFLKTTNEIRTKGFGKAGNKIYKYVLKDLFLPYYDEWVVERNIILSNLGKETDSLFINRLGEPAAVQTVNEWRDKWGEYLGKDIYMHSLRHYCVTHLTRIGLTSDFIIGIMGWKSGEMYKIYNDLTEEDKKWADTDVLKKYLEKEEEEDEN
jgi:integrase